MDIFDLLNRVFFGSGLTIAVFLCGTVLFWRLGRCMKSKMLISALKKSGGDISPARAMCIALAGTLGVGNISGVASAIAIGGAGAVFWMWISSLFAMFIKYAETVLALGHRRLSNGRHGGAYFYMSDMGAKGSARLFALLCLASSLMLGSSIQSNSAAVCIESLLGTDRAVIGIFLCIAVFLMISGGLRRIADFVSVAIPVISIFYVLMSLYIIISNIGILPKIISEIFEAALGKRAFGGGILGFITSRAVSLGVTRGIVSNEAGCGTAPIAHSSSASTEPVVQGIFGMLEVFIDTGVLCSMTALSVLIAKEKGVALSSDGMATALAAFEAFIPFSGIFMTVTVMVFVFATILCWFYYGSECLYFLCGRGIKAYRYIYSAAVLLGAALPTEGLWGVSDLVVSLMTALNIFYIMKGLPELWRETDRYFQNNS